LLEHEVAFMFELRGQSPGVAQGLTRDVFRIGSDMENDLILKDAGVALYQAEIRLEKEQFLIRNFSVEGSVYLNGEAFEEASLRKGDILTVGDSIFRFVPQGEALTQEELWRPVGGKKPLPKAGFSPIKRLTFLASLSVLALGAILWIALNQTPRKDPLTAVKDGGVPSPSPRTDPRALSTLYDRGVDLLSARHWDRALVVFERVQLESPNYKELDRLVQEGVMESQAAQRLNQGKGKYLEGALASAREDLAKIGESSVVYREAEKLLREVEQKAVFEHIDRARKMMADKDWVSARGEVESALESDPGNVEASDLLRQIKRMDLAPSKNWYYSRRTPTSPADTAVGTAVPVPAPERTQPAKTAPVSPVAKGGQGGVPVPRTGGGGIVRSSPAAVSAPSVQVARAAYLKGQTGRSISDLERILQGGRDGAGRVEAGRMVQDVRDAKSFFHQAETLQKEGRTREALEVWDRFLEKDRAVAGSQESAYCRKASVLLGQIYYQRGQEEFERDRVVPAARFWRMAQQIDPGNEDVKKGIRRLTESARKYYREGYSLQSINPPEAREKWKVVMQIVPPGDPYYQKARREIERSAAIP